MSMIESWRAPPGLVSFDTEKALRLQAGLLSPLWWPVAAAAAMGAAAWGFTRWMRLAAPEGAVGEVEIVAPPTSTPPLEIDLFSEPATAPAPENVEMTPDPVTEAPIPVSPELAAPAVAAALAPTPVAPEVTESVAPKAAAKKSGARKARPSGP